MVCCDDSIFTSRGTPLQNVRNFPYLISKRARAIHRQAEAVRETLRLAQIRYGAGYIAFIEVLEAQRTLLEAELLITDAERDRLLATAALFKALGGGFS